MSKWQLLDYPERRVTEDAPGAALTSLLSGKPTYLLHDQVVFLLTMDTVDIAGVHERTLILAPIAAIGDLGHADLRRLRERGPFRSAPLRLPAYDDPGATAQIAGLLTERAGQAFLDQVQDELHK